MFRIDRGAKVKPGGIESSAIINTAGRIVEDVSRSCFPVYMLEIISRA